MDNNFERELVIIAEEMAKLYKHTDKIMTTKGKILVDIKFDINERQVDITLTTRIKKLLQKYGKEYTPDELSNLLNSVKRQASKKINRYRKEIGIKQFEPKNGDIALNDEGR